jgi:hypothetical protein
VVCWIRRRQIEKKIRKSKEKKMGGISRISIKKENPRENAGTETCHAVYNGPVFSLRKILKILP